MRLPLRFSLYLLFLLLPCVAQAQADVPVGARAAALGNAAVTLHDLWALSNNIAGIADLKQPEVGAYVENRFGVRAFTTVALEAVYPTGKYGSYGLSLSRFGDELYSRQSVGLGVAHKLGQFSLGAKAEVWQIAVKGYGSRKAVTLSAGLQAEVIPDLYFGAYAYNLNQAKLADFEDERLPTIMKAGLAYRPYKKLLLAIETEKNIDYDADFKAGLEYTLLDDNLVLRTGFSTLTNKATFGIGFRARQLQVDYAFGSTTLLGQSHHLSLSYQFEKSK
ncbi:hypothetical protein I2I11_01875 [Pontibacter sp. 172403-2]|uniref:hypothetical protein n=1 Tax=Pontibacter rufus TaxID=2791028 RepID=UPI0018AFA480|nr:hypothetical protein [Pontibacter sp. 172403-2]MBF9252033.1 hypothetical protein [Pontibacter sp. 172403-2]